MLLGDNRVTSVAWASSGEFIASGLLLAGLVTSGVTSVAGDVWHGLSRVI